MTNIFKSLSVLLGGSEWYLHEFNPIHSFIPTFSSIAYLSPNQNWNNPINTNLTCPSSKQTPFDSYYGEAKNSQHTSFTNESVNWLLKELGDLTHLPVPQAPHFPIQNNVLTGSPSICANFNSTYTIDDICKVPSPVKYTQNGVAIDGWSVQGNLQIVTSTPYSITVTGTNDNPNDATITATFQNGQFITIPVHVGAPKPTFTSIYNSWDWVCANSGSFSMGVTPAPFATSYYWVATADTSEFAMVCPTINQKRAKFTGGTFGLDTNGNYYASSPPSSSPTATINWGTCLGTYLLECYAVNECGSTLAYLSKYTTVGKPQNNPCTHNGLRLKIAPNPVSSGETNFVVSKSINYTPCNYIDYNSNTPIYIPQNRDSGIAQVSIYDYQGIEVYNNTFNTPQYVEVRELPKEDESNPDEERKYEELSHFNIQNLYLSPGLYIIKVKDGSDYEISEHIMVE